MDERQRVECETDSVQDAFRRRGDEDADPDRNASERDGRETAPTSAQLRTLILEEIAPRDVRDEGNAKLQYPAINQGLRRSRFDGSARDDASQNQRGDKDEADKIQTYEASKCQPPAVER